MSVELSELNQLALDVSIAFDALSASFNQFEDNVNLRLNEQECVDCQQPFSSLIEGMALIKTMLYTLSKLLKLYSFDQPTIEEVRLQPLQIQLEITEEQETEPEPN